MINVPNGFTDEQKNYLQGFMMGADVSRAVRNLPILSGQGGTAATALTIGQTGAEVDGQPIALEPIHRQAQDRTISAGGKLCGEEQAKRNKNPLDMWNEMCEHAASRRFPKGTDVFLFKFQGLFHVAPAQDAFMCRLRIPGGILRADQFRGVAELARQHAGGYADVTTRANLQLREIGPADGVPVLMGLHDLGIINRGSGGDNVRNVTANPTSGIDPQELIETLPLAKQMHHFILNHRELSGLPRKFNIAFDGGSRISSLEDTNDVGFTAVRIADDKGTEETPAGIYFRLALGGITGHLDFARDTGILCSPEECVAVADAILRVFIAHGDRTDRKKARLKYLLDDWGFEKFLAHVQEELSFPLRRFSLADCEQAPASDRFAHIGVHPQKQPGLNYVGVVLPVGRLTSEQMEGLSDLSERYGDRTIRLTVWQNLLLSGVADEHVQTVQQGIEALGLDWQASSVRSGLVACTGNAGCKFAAADTKGHAMQIARYLEDRIQLETPVNIHLTGCHHSCAQHYIGDIGLIATKVEVGEDDDLVEGYHLFVGGGWGREQGIAAEFQSSVPHYDCPQLIERILRTYLDQRLSPQETFVQFVRRISIDDLKRQCNHSLEVMPL